MPGTVLRIWEEAKKSKTSLSVWGLGRKRELGGERERGT